MIAGEPDTNGEGLLQYDYKIQLFSDVNFEEKNSDSPGMECNIFLPFQL
jgi:hypothetical protein